MLNQNPAIRKRKLAAGIILTGIIFIFTHIGLLLFLRIPAKFIQLATEPLVILVLFLPVMFWVGNFIFARSFQGLRSLKLNPEILLALALTVGFVYSLASIFFPTIFIRLGVVADQIFDELSIIITLALMQDYLLIWTGQKNQTKTNPETLSYLKAKIQTNKLIIFSFALAQVTSVAWYYFGNISFADIVNVYLALLVIPGVYLFLQSSPIIIAKAKVILENNGIITRFDWVPEAFLQTKTIVFNKTNTLTEGRLEVSDIVAARPKEILKIVASLEQDIPGVIAKAILTRATSDNIKLEKPIAKEYLVGQGVTGLIEGKKYAVGTMKLMGDQGVVVGVLQREKSRLEQQGKTVIIVGRAEKSDRFNPNPGEVLGMVGLSNEVNQSAKSAIAGLKKVGMNVLILTSDGQRTAQAIGTELKISPKNIFGDLDIEQKKNKLNELKSTGDMVTYVGSDMVDLELAKNVDLCLQVGQTSREFNGKNQVVMTSYNLLKIVDFYNISKGALRRVGYNSQFGLFYNGIALPVGAGLLYLSTNKLLLAPSLAMGISFAGLLISLGSSLLWRHKK